MKKLILIKRRRDLVIEIDKVTKEKEEKNFYIKATSIVMISKRIDEFEDKVRKKMKSEMRIFSSDTHSQEFLRSLIPSLNKDRKC